MSVRRAVKRVEYCHGLTHDTKICIRRGAGLVKVNPVYFTDKTVVIKGLEDGTSVLSRAVPGAYPGMKVSLNGSNPRK